MLANVRLRHMTRDPWVPDDVCLQLYYHAVTDASSEPGASTSRTRHCRVHYGPLVLEPQPLGAGWCGDGDLRDGPTGSRVEATNGTTYVYATAEALGRRGAGRALVATLGPYDPLGQPSRTAGSAPPLWAAPVLGGDPPA